MTIRLGPIMLLILAIFVAKISIDDMRSAQAEENRHISQDIRLPANHRQ